MIKLQQLREMTSTELEQKRNELLDEQFNLRMRLSLKSLDNPLRLRIIRKEMAKVITVLREDELGIRKLAETSSSILGDSKAKDKDKEEKGKDK